MSGLIPFCCQLSGTSAATLQDITIHNNQTIPQIIPIAYSNWYDFGGKMKIVIIVHAMKACRGVGV
jgi:hypothetical protein